MPMLNLQTRGLRLHFGALMKIEHEEHASKLRAFLSGDKWRLRYFKAHKELTKV